MLRNGQTVLSPWIDRRSDNLRSVIDVIALSSAQEMVVGLYTKDLTDPGDGIAVDSNTRLEITSSGLRLQEWGSTTGVGLKELVRYRFATAGGTDSTFIVFRMLPPVWFDTIQSRSSGIPSGGAPI
jgi:hypothetical protein